MAPRCREAPPVAEDSSGPSQHGDLADGALDFDEQEAVAREVETAPSSLCDPDSNASRRRGSVPDDESEPFAVHTAAADADVDFLLRRRAAPGEVRATGELGSDYLDEPAIAALLGRGDPQVDRTGGGLDHGSGPRFLDVDSRPTMDLGDQLALHGVEERQAILYRLGRRAADDHVLHDGVTDRGQDRSRRDSREEDERARQDPAAGARSRRSGSVDDVAPVRHGLRARNHPIELGGDDQLDVGHDGTSFSIRRRTACAALSVAETVPTSTSSASAMAR